jgi:hypothetical protein
MNRGDCDGDHEMSDWGADGGALHSGAKCVEAVWRATTEGQWCPINQRTRIMSMYDREKPNRTSNACCLPDAELEKVNGGIVASRMAYVHAVFTASATDLVFGGKGFVSEAAYDAAMGYLRGQ